MLHGFISIIGILITIFFVIGTHEAAHFAMARMLGVKVLRFSIGFGKTLLSWHDRKGTEYVLALIPLGGYVKMLDETEEPVPPEQLPYAYNRQPFYKKFLIVLAGPLTNILCALILYWLIFMIGFTTFKPLIGTVDANSIAAQAGLKKGQEIVGMDNQPISAWTGFILRLLAHAGDNDHVTLDVQNAAKQNTQHVLDLNHWRLDGLKPDPLASIGITPYMPTIPLTIGKIVEQSPAALSGLQLNDKIIAINHQTISTWDQIVLFITTHPNQHTTFTIERDHKTMQIPVKIGYQRSWMLQKSGYLGMGPYIKLPDEMLRKIKYSPLAAIAPAFRELYDFTYFNILLIGKLITGKLSLQSLGGPITIFDTAGDALNSGLVAFLGFLAFLSISIGVINFLPLPGLDGGHLFIQIVELLIRRPVPEMLLSVLYRGSFMLIFFILLIALVNDLLRLFF